LKASTQTALTTCSQLRDDRSETAEAKTDRSRP
jgi:hypothetical protein